MRLIGMTSGTGISGVTNVDAVVATSQLFE